jgi:hypothetical protein
MAAEKSHHNCPKIRYQAGHTIRQLLLTGNARFIPGELLRIVFGQKLANKMPAMTRPNLNAHSYRLRRIANAAISNPAKRLCTFSFIASWVRNKQTPRCRHRSNARQPTDAIPTTGPRSVTFPGGKLDQHIPRTFR